MVRYLKLENIYMINTTTKGAKYDFKNIVIYILFLMA